MARGLMEREFTQEKPAPQFYLPLQEIKDSVQLVNYPSEDFELKGLLHLGNIDSTQKKKGLVYLHGGFALGNGDLADCSTFIQSDFIVFAPSYRGENGNPGFFEYFRGELTDAENAVNWLAEQDYTHQDSIYVFGHSIGGAMSLILSINDNCDSQLNGSSAGLYFEESLAQLAGEENIPFDTTEQKEYNLRIPLYHLDKLQRKHFMYVGSEDYYSEIKDLLLEGFEKPLEYFQLEEVEGDHFSSLDEAQERFVEEIKKGQ